MSDLTPKPTDDVVLVFRQNGDMPPKDAWRRLAGFLKAAHRVLGWTCVGGEALANEMQRERKGST